jgi:hypothetical protein
LTGLLRELVSRARVISAAFLARKNLRTEVLHLCFPSSSLLLGLIFLSLLSLLAFLGNKGKESGVPLRLSFSVIIIIIAVGGVVTRLSGRRHK